MIIRKIEVKDKKVKIFLDNKESFEISLETYISNEILLDSKIDTKRIEFLKGQDNYNALKMMLLNKLNNKRMSKQECLNYLLENDLDIIDCNKIINEFERNYLINDLELAELVIEAALINKKGINVIKEKLKSRLIRVDYDGALTKFLDREIYNKNVQYQLDKYFKLGKNKSKVELKKYLCIKMMENGYLKEDFVDLLDRYEVDEYSAIFMEIEKFMKNREINRENIAKITKKLLSKGFNYAIIKDVIRECGFNETY